MITVVPIGLHGADVRKTPWVSYAIILVNVLVFLALWADDVSPARFGYVPAAPEPIHLVTNLFVHAGLLHLFGNMLLFYVTGPFVEDAYGKWLFGFLYISSGVVANLVDAAHDPASLIPRVGASGAIAGILGAFLVRYTRRRIRFLWMPLFPFLWWSREFRVPAFVYLPFWFLVQYLIAVASGDDSGVAVWAHVGGFTFGFIAGFLIGFAGFERRFITPGEPLRVSNADLAHAIKEGHLGHLDTARRETERILAAAPGNLDARRYAFELAVESGDREGIAVSALRLLDLYISLGEKDLARGLIRELGERGYASAGSRFLLRAGDFLAKEGDAARAVDVYEALLRTYPQHPSSLRNLLKISELRQQAGDVAGAREALERARRHPEYFVATRPR